MSFTALGTVAVDDPGTATWANLVKTNFDDHETRILSKETGDGAVQYAEVSLSSADILALRATPKTLVAAPAAGKILCFHRAVLLLDATATAYVESAANLAIKYTDGSGVAVCETIEATGFIDQTADTMTAARPKLDPIVAKTGCEAKALVLHNTGAGEYTTGTGTMRVKVWFSVLTSGW
jgi:hypothetical protein